MPLAAALLALAFRFDLAAPGIQIETDHELKRLIKGLAEQDYVGGYEIVRRAKMVSLFWEFTVSDEVVVRGTPKKDVPVIRLWVWNNTPRPITIKPSSFRYLWTGTEYARNDSASAGPHAAQVRDLPAYTLAEMDMVMDVRVGHRPGDLSGLLYTSPRPGETIVLQRFAYWKNLLSDAEFSASLKRGGQMLARYQKDYRTGERKARAYALELTAILAKDGTTEIPDYLRATD